MTKASDAKCQTCYCDIRKDDANVYAVAGKGKRPATYFHTDWQDCALALQANAVRFARKSVSIRFGRSPEIDVEPTYL
jgi:hypothetical protein